MKHIKKYIIETIFLLYKIGIKSKKNIRWIRRLLRKFAIKPFFRFWKYTTFKGWKYATSRGWKYIIKYDVTKVYVIKCLFILYLLGMSAVCIKLLIYGSPFDYVPSIENKHWLIEQERLEEIVKFEEELRKTGYLEKEESIHDGVARHQKKKDDDILSTLCFVALFWAEMYFRIVWKV